MYERKDGFIRCKIDGEIKELSENIELDKNKKHIILVVVDRLVIKEDIRARLYDSLETACKLSQGKVIIELPTLNEEIILSEDFACPYCDFSLFELDKIINFISFSFIFFPQSSKPSKSVSVFESLLNRLLRVTFS